MAIINKTEVWLRGPLADVPDLLQPVAHALLQAGEEIKGIMDAFPQSLLWDKPAGLASPGFHLQHITGVLDRLFTYANGQMLNEQQLHYLMREGKMSEDSIENLIDQFNKQLALSIVYLKKQDPGQLTQIRGVGRAQIPSTQIGLLVHAAEHTMRHIGQLLVTVRILRHQYADKL
jgi:hypothetical protein